MALVTAASPLPADVKSIPGAINGLRVGDTVFYGDVAARPRPARHVLFTHGRRDVVWAGQSLVRAAKAIAPAGDRAWIEAPEAFWADFKKTRFHDYAQHSTKVPREPLPIHRGVRGGDVLDLDGLHIDVLDTPGYTPGAVTYLFEIGGRRIACTGDLIYAGGRLLDVYSLQDAIPEVGLRGYHGFAARAGPLIASLRALAARKPDVLVPARGPLITSPAADIEALIARLQALMASHFATDALLWYFGDDNLRVRSSKVLDGKAIDSMPMAETKELPKWIIPIENSRLIVSSSGAAFLSDAGFENAPARLEALRKEGRFRSLEGIWVTHYHDDHTHNVQAVADAFGAPVYFTAGMTDILQHPERHRMPCLTTNAITAKWGQPHGRVLKWREFQLTSFDFPGQTLYHGGLLVRREAGEQIFLVGDSFTPSGMDDYCLYNRNLVGEGQGFLAALDVLARVPQAWLINQHVLPMFRFDDARVRRMRAELARRRLLLSQLSPWPHPNYSVDESWARVYPYATNAQPDSVVELELRIRNHGRRAERYTVAWSLPAGLTLIYADRQVRIPAGAEGRARANVRVRARGLHILAADVAFGSLRLREWSEAMVNAE